MGKGNWGSNVGGLTPFYSEESEGAEIKDGGQLLKVSWNYRKKRQPLDSAFETEMAEKGQQWMRGRTRPATEACPSFVCGHFQLL